MSIIILVFVLGYTYLMFKKCFDHGEDVMNYQYMDEPTEELGMIELKELHEVMFFQFSTTFGHSKERRAKTGSNDHNKDIKYDEEFLRHLDVKFE